MIAQAEPTPAALAGLHNLLFEYADVGEGDGVLLAYRRECCVAACWVAGALCAAGARTELICLESADEAEFEKRLFPALAKLRAPGRHIHIFVGEGQSLSFTRTLRRLMADPSVSVVRLMNFTPDLFELALSVSPATLKQINAGLLARLMHKQSIEVVTGDGAVLAAEIEPAAYQWISNFGLPNPGELIALPAGEVNTYPAAIRGEFVADGALHANIPMPFDVRLHATPVTVRIEDGAVEAFSCDDSNLSRALEVVFSNDLCRKIGELGFGTNVGVTRFTAENTHINERFPAVHIGLGEHTQPGRVTYEAPIHIDLIARRSLVRTFDGRPEISMSALRPSNRPHPQDTRGEDIEHVPA